MITDLDIYLFDLRGYLLLEQALNADEVRALNALLDPLATLAPGQWSGHVHAHQYGATDGLNLNTKRGTPCRSLPLFA